MREFHEEQIRGLKTIFNVLSKDTNLTLTLSRIGYPDLVIVKRDKSFLLLYSDDKRLRNFYYLIYTLMLLTNDGDVLFVNNDVTPIDQLEKANNTTGQYKEHIIKNESFLLFLNNNWNKTIIFSFALIDYIDHGKTPDQRRFLKTMEITNFAVGVAILIGLIGIGLNIYALCKATKFDNTQLNQVEQTLRGVIRDEIAKDTLKVKVVSSQKIRPIQSKSTKK